MAAVAFNGHIDQITAQPHQIAVVLVVRQMNGRGLQALFDPPSIARAVLVVGVNATGREHGSRKDESGKAREGSDDGQELSGTHGFTSCCWLRCRG